MRAALLLVALLLASAPPAVAEHCEERLDLHARRALLPTPAPPAAGAHAGGCLRVFGDEVADTHVFSPGVDELTVIVREDFGGAVPTLVVELDGMGFAGEQVTLTRVRDRLGEWSYELGAWIPIPAPQGDLIATGHYPTGAVQVTYSAFPL